MYKKIIFVLLVILCGYTYGQTPNYSNIVAKLKSTNPEIDLTNKILMVSIWNSSDAASREMNKEFYRTYKTYQHARLSGGLKGVVFVSISSDLEELNFQIAAKKDLTDYSIVYCDFSGYKESGLINECGIEENHKNLIFNNLGELIISNLLTESIFITFNKLTTR